MLKGALSVPRSKTVVAIGQGYCDRTVYWHILLFIVLTNQFGFCRMLIPMVDKLEAENLCQVMDLLEPCRQRAHIFKALFDQLRSHEAQDVLMELSY